MEGCPKTFVTGLKVFGRLLSVAGLITNTIGLGYNLIELKAALEAEDWAAVGYYTYQICMNVAGITITSISLLTVAGVLMSNPITFVVGIILIITDIVVRFGTYILNQLNRMQKEEELEATDAAWNDYNAYLHSSQSSRFDEFKKYGRRFIYLGADFDDILEIGWGIVLWVDKTDLHTTTYRWNVTPETYQE